MKKPGPVLVPRAAKPLTGVRVLITRAAHQVQGLSLPLRELGAEVIEVPTIEIVGTGNSAQLEEACLRIDHYSWLILTSVNGVERFFARYHRLGLPIADMEHLQIAAIGPATRDAIQKEGLSVSVMPERYVAESVVEALKGKTQGQRILLVRAKVARDVLPNELRLAGATVDVIDAYETRIPEGARERLHNIFSSPGLRPQFVTFTSSSTATNFLTLLGDKSGRFLEGVKLASIGPVTSATLRAAGFEPAVEAAEYTMPGLVQAIRDHV